MALQRSYLLSWLTALAAATRCPNPEVHGSSRGLPWALLPVALTFGASADNSDLKTPKDG